MSASQLRLLVPAAVAVLGLAVLELAYGVPFGDLVIFLAYQTGFVIVPGCLLLRALSSRRDGPLRTVALGWGLGYVLSILAFMLTASLGVRDLYLAYPVLVITVALALRRPRGLREGLRALGASAVPTRFAWGLTAVLVAAMAYFAIAYFSSTPLPGDRSITYFRDYPWHISLAAEAKNHWPIQDPHAVGAPQPYHYFVHLQMAATSQVTGLDLPLIFFRLSPLPLVALFVLQLAAAGRSLTGSAWTGLIGAALFLLIGDLQMDPNPTPFTQFPFLGLSFVLLFLSPSFLFGMVTFVPLMQLVGERITSPDTKGSVGDWLLIALFAIGAANAKVTVLPLILGGLVLYAAWSRLSTGTISRSVIWSMAVVAVVGGISYLLLWVGHGSGLGLDPFRTFFQMPVPSIVDEYLTGAGPDFPLKAALLDIGVVVIGGIGLFAAQLAGLGWLSRYRSKPLSPGIVWLLALFACGLAVMVAIGAPGSGNQTYFIFLAVVPGCLASALGLRLAWARRGALRGRERQAVGLGLLWILVLAALVAAPGALDLFSDPNELARSFLFWYGGLAVSVIALFVAARRLLRASRWVAAGLCTGAVLIVGAMSTPISYLIPAIDPASAPAASRGLTPELYQAMLWLRDETPTDAVVAVNDDDMANFSYSAFGERRVFIEGWLYSQTSVDAGFGAVASGEVSPFADRLEVNRRALAEADPEALRALREDYGVRYLILDEANGYAAAREELAGMFETVYEQPGILILDMNGES